MASSTRPRCYGDGAVADEPGEPRDDDVAARGRLTLKDRVAERIATRAALDTRGVRSHSGAVGRLVGRDLPRTHVAVAGDRIRAEVDIAVAWSHQLPVVAAEVHRNVTAALTEMAGLHVDGVTVRIDRIVADDVRPERTLL